jgi:hypothetical protein
MKKLLPLVSFTIGNSSLPETDTPLVGFPLRSFVSKMISADGSFS